MLLFETHCIIFTLKPIFLGRFTPGSLSYSSWMSLM